MAFDEVSSPVLAKQFSNVDFDPDEYVKDVLANCDIYRALYDQRNKIQKLGEETAISLKKNVYRNYRQFIDTAKEISYLEAEMYQLSHLLTEQKTTLADQIGTDIFECPKLLSVQKDGKEDESEVKSKSFFDSLKASKEVLDELSTKELLLEGELTEFDPETYMSINQINACLLTDNLLITSAVTNGKISILTMFDLSDLAVVNVRDGQGAKNAFKILYSLETRMFSAPSKEMKLAWLDKIEKAKKNYKKGLKLDSRQIQEMMERQEKKEEAYDKHVPESTEATVTVEPFPDLLNVDWLVELPEDLDMSIAQRDFAGAVSLVEKSRAYLADFPDTSALKEMKKTIETRTEQLVSMLEKSLDNSASSRHVSLRSIRVYIQLLLRLGRSKLACQLFLRNRSYEIKNNFKQLKMEGAIAMYINKLANLFFTALIETGLEYKKNFPLNKNASAFVVWAHDELQTFAVKFSRQVFTRNTTLAAIAVCTTITLSACARLEVIGIDMLFDLQHMLLKDVMPVMFDTRDQLLERGKLRAMEDAWDESDYIKDMNSLNNLQNELISLGLVGFDSYVVDGRVKLSSSTLVFTKDILAFYHDGRKLHNPEIHSAFVQCIADCFKAQAIQFERLFNDSTIQMKHPFILSNVGFVCDVVFEFLLTKLTLLVGSEVTIMKAIAAHFQKLKRTDV